MPINRSIKELAYKIDPECWESYSGKPLAFKQSVERRRNAALNKAHEESGLPLLDYDSYKGSDM